MLHNERARQPPGTLELFHRSTLSLQQIAGEATGNPVAVFQRIDQAGYKQPIDERILADCDTLMVFGLDHLLSEQEAAPEEVGAIQEWLKREGTCLLLAPHHDVGFTDNLQQRQVEYLHAPAYKRINLRPSLQSDSGVREAALR